MTYFITALQFIYFAGPIVFFVFNFLLSFSGYAKIVSKAGFQKYYK